MRRLERIGDPDEVLAVAKRLGKVFGVGVTGAIKRLAHGGPQPGRRETRSEPVDRHDAAGMEHLAVALDRLELRVVQGPAPPESLQPPRDDDLLPWS